MMGHKSIPDGRFKGTVEVQLATAIIIIGYNCLVKYTISNTSSKALYNDNFLEMMTIFFALYHKFST